MATMTLSRLWSLSRSSNHSTRTNERGFSVGSQGPQKATQIVRGFFRLITIAVLAGALGVTIAWVALLVYGLFWLATTVF
jgi:hypothetical protein